MTPTFSGIKGKIGQDLKRHNTRLKKYTWDILAYLPRYNISHLGMKISRLIFLGSGSQMQTKDTFLTLAQLERILKNCFEIGILIRQAHIFQYAQYIVAIQVPLIHPSFTSFTRTTTCHDSSDLIRFHRLGTGVMIFKIFSSKNLEKNFLLKVLLLRKQKGSKDWISRKTPIFSPKMVEYRRKS
jgi:hypothetical protein